MFDLEMIRDLARHGIENYARHLTGRPRRPPPTLLLLPAERRADHRDESHQTVQVRRRGDRSRKEVLVAYGFRLLSAPDNRPLTCRSGRSVSAS